MFKNDHKVQLNIQVVNICNKDGGRERDRERERGWRGGWVWRGRERETGERGDREITIIITLPRCCQLTGNLSVITKSPTFRTSGYWRFLLVAIYFAYVQTYFHIFT
jgi:hypothetical protein